MRDLLQAESHPLIAGGGVFLALMGAGIIAGGLFPLRRRWLLGASFIVASVTTSLVARSLAAPFGAPTRLQIAVLVVAVVVEVVVIQLMVPRLWPRGERTVTLGVLAVVGAHFLPMVVAFGPVVGVLGLVSIGNAAVGLWVAPQISLRMFWVIDGGLKLMCGLVMVSALAVAA